ncbi:MAG: hypothetical protein HOL97_01170, partial [Rhodospirillaceae bacterium]|nr:hypothetical protein [Rhodospirillaceae bacterium]
DPLERDAKLVELDVSQGLVSVAGAADNYGVVIGAEDMKLDKAATDALRAEMRK